MTRSDTHTDENGGGFGLYWRRRPRRVVEAATVFGATRARKRACAPTSLPHPYLSPPRTGEHEEEPPPLRRGRLASRAGRVPSDFRGRPQPSTPSTTPRGGRRLEELSGRRRVHAPGPRQATRIFRGTQDCRNDSRTRMSDGRIHDERSHRRVAARSRRVQGSHYAEWRHVGCDDVGMRALLACRLPGSDG